MNSSPKLEVVSSKSDPKVGVEWLKLSGMLSGPPVSNESAKFLKQACLKSVTLVLQLCRDTGPKHITLMYVRVLKLCHIAQIIVGTALFDQRDLQRLSCSLTHIWRHHRRPYFGAHDAFYIQRTTFIARSLSLPSIRSWYGP